MPWTQTTLNIKDAAATNQPVIAYTDGTNFSFAHPLLDNTGAVIAPATSGNQTSGNSTLSSILTACQAATPAGTNLMGKVGIDQTMPGTTNLVQLPAPQITTGSTTMRPANATAYAAGQLLANSTTAGSVTFPTIGAARGVGINSTLLRLRLLKSGTSLVNAIFRVHLYNAQPSVTNGDGGVWLSTTAGYVGAVDVTIAQAFSDGSAGIGIPTAGSLISFVPASGTANLYYLIEVRAAYTPVSGEVFTPIVEIQ